MGRGPYRREVKAATLARQDALLHPLPAAWAGTAPHAPHDPHGQRDRKAEKHQDDEDFGETHGERQAYRRVRSAAHTCTRHPREAEIAVGGVAPGRTCIARDDRRTFVCLLVDTRENPAQVHRDPSTKPNSAVTDEQ